MNSNIVRNKNLVVVSAAAVGLFAFLFIQLVSAASTGSILPSSDGSYLEWTPKTGSTHYTMVDESVCNGTTDYNTANTVGLRDSYSVSISSLPNGSTITSLAIIPCASRSKTGGGSSVMDVFYRYDGIDSPDAGSYSLSGTSPVQLVTTTFSGLSLVKNSTSNLQVGAVLSSGTKGARLGRMAVVVTYSLPTPPVAPSSLSATNVSGSQNNLSWTDNSSNEDGFKVERSTTGPFGLFSQIATTSAGVTSYDDTGLVADTTYYYRVRAFNSAGNSNYSNTVYVITATVVPSAPSNLVALSSSSPNAYLYWAQTSANEEGFKVERSTDGVNFSEIATKGMNAVNHEDIGLVPGLYFFRVKAFNAVGDSNYSNIATTTVL